MSGPMKSHDDVPLRQTYASRNSIKAEDKSRRSLSAGNDPVNPPEEINDNVPHDKKMVRQPKFSFPAPVATQLDGTTSTRTLRPLVSSNSSNRISAPAPRLVAQKSAEKMNKPAEASFSYKPRIPDVSYADTVSPELLKSLTPEERTRQAVIFELINTELLYFRDLRILTDAFLRPIRESQVLDEESINGLFRNIHELEGVSENFMRDLESLQKKDAIVERIGDTILMHVDKLRPAFVEFCCRQTVSIKLLDELMETNEAFRNFLQTRAHKPIFRSLKLGSFLSAPFQRLCKYPLLLGEIKKQTPPGHPDALGLEDALAKMKGILSEANAQAVKIEEAYRLKELREKMDEKYTKLLEQCELQLDEEEVIVEYETTGGSFPTYMILLDKFLLFTKKKRYNIKVKRKMDLEALQLWEEAEENPFEIFILIEGSPTHFTFKTTDIKTRWRERLQINIEAHLEALVRKKALRVRRAKGPMQPKKIDPGDERGSLEHENQLLANQLHQIVLAGAQLPSTSNTQYLPVGGGSKTLKSTKRKGPGDTGSDASDPDFKNPEGQYIDSDTLSSLSASELKPDWSLFRGEIQPQLLVIFQGPHYAGKSTIIRKLISTCCNSHNFRCAYLNERDHFEIYYPFGENQPVDRAQLTPALVHSSRTMGSSVRTCLNVVSTVSHYDLLFVDGCFEYESQMTSFLGELEGLDVKRLLCTVMASDRTLEARQQRDTEVEEPLYLSRRNYGVVPDVSNIIQLNTTQPLTKCVTYVLHRILSCLRD